MTSEKRAQVQGTSENQKGTRHKLGTSLKIDLCPSKVLFSFYFFTKGHKGTSKKGGIAETEKHMKTAQKETKREKNTEIQRNRKNLCLVPFEKSGALA